ncbi:hypothetical protein BaRGS_00003603 [Batillaria attramentaria]|uniref:BTB domain-containing protein n=1 Tax=Batillaria attramentaria TaxID=370345 RepID=A0ABD0M0W4_9CAEN
MAGKLNTEHPAGPFETPDDTTDVIFIVEQKKLYFNKVLLGMCSPVFKRMFTADFKEKSEKEIPLPGKKHEDMVAFLQQIHPLHCGEPITDTNISQILPLADEYDVDSIRKKCEQYIGVQVQLNAAHKLSNDRPPVLLAYGGEVQNSHSIDRGFWKLALRGRQQTCRIIVVSVLCQAQLRGIS